MSELFETAAPSRGNPRGSGYERNANDWYVEPPWAVHDLFDVERFDDAIWDPSCGRGTIPTVAQLRGYEAIGTDLVDRGFGAQCDFLGIREAPALGTGATLNIVSNPPFGIIERWIKQALLLCPGKIAVFARLALLEGQDRGRMFQSTPLARVWVFSGRVPCPPGEQAPPGRQLAPRLAGRLRGLRLVRLVAGPRRRSAARFPAARRASRAAGAAARMSA